MEFTGDLDRYELQVATQEPQSRLRSFLGRTGMQGAHETAQSNIDNTLLEIVDDRGGIKDPELRRKVIIALKTKNDDTLLDAADAITDHLLDQDFEARDPYTQTFALLHLAKAIDEEKIKLEGNSPAASSNGIFNLTVKQLGG